MSYSEKIQSLIILENQHSYNEFLRKIRLEIDDLEIRRKLNYDILLLLRRRELLKGQMNTTSQRYKTQEDIKLFQKDISSHLSTLGTIGCELIKQLERRRRKGLTAFQFRGIDPLELVKLDFWEDEYMRKVEVRTELMEKFHQKKVSHKLGSWAKK